jgi:lysozyme
MSVRRAHLVLAFLAACGGAAREDVGTATEADMAVCAAGTVLQGCDVSSYQPGLDWSQLQASGVAFGIAKATEGTSIADSEFANNWTGMKAAGVVRGAYHYYHCTDDPTQQANYFLGVLGTLQQGDLPPALDFEDPACNSSPTAIQDAITWLDAVGSATGTLPLIYTSPGFLDGFGDQNDLAGHAQLWVANWQVNCPNVPSPFTTWPFWQDADTGPGGGDADEFNGDMAALMALAVGGGGTSTSSTSGASSTSGGPPTCMVNGVDGTCIDTTVCANMGGMSTPNLCPGPADEQCCTLPPGTGSSTGAGGATTTGTSGAGAGGAATTGGGTATTGSGTATTGAGGANMGGTTAATSGTGGAGTTGTSTGAGPGATTGGSPGTSSGCAVAPGDDGGLGVRGWLAAVAVAALVRRRRRR